MILDTTNKRLDSLSSGVGRITHSLEFSQAELEDLKIGYQTSLDCHKTVSKDLDSIQSSLDILSSTSDYLENQTRRNNLLFDGIPDSTTEEATKILQQFPRFHDVADMSTPVVLLTAFTGTAAYNISGKTLHSILKLPKSLKLLCKGLGNKLEELRATLASVEILIICKISMVSKDLFSYMHWRFQQIKGNKKPFGGVSVLAVGDFYQLPPLGRAKPLCVYEEGVLDMWKENFQVVNLTQIMCQKDDLVFAKLLKRIGVKPKNDVLSNEDKALLGQAVKDAKLSA